MPDGLILAALTHGVDPADVLVVREGAALEALPKGALIATSSERREACARLLRSDFQFCDLRGTIAERLKLIEEGKVDGVVVAEAALIRLKLTHLNRFRLPGPTAPLQGQLAVIVCAQDAEAQKIFAPFDSRCQKSCISV